MADLSGEAIGRSSPQELVAVLEKLQPDAAARLDVDAIGRAKQLRAVWSRSTLRATVLGEITSTTSVGNVFSPRRNPARRPVPNSARRLKVRGDLAFTAGLMSLFDLPCT